MTSKKSSGNLLNYFSVGIKVIGDRAMAALLLLLFSPIMIVVAIVVRLRMGTPIVFTQARPGRNGKIFTVYKFRTMTGDCDAEGNLLSDEERLIPLGQFLRKASLDEFPQLWNVLVGDMSFVGPRPALFNQEDLIALRTDAEVHLLRPGITGWAQVNGRNAISWDKKFELDVWYVNNCSFSVDMKILIKTVLKVVKKEGINAANVATIEPFNGKN